MNDQLKLQLAAKRRHEMPKVLLAAAECAPLAKTGGLADVVGTLPKYLADLGMDARVITPYHRVIKNKYSRDVRHMCDFYIDLGWRHKYVGLEKLVLDGVTIYLIDNEDYFGDKIYRGGEAEGEQYAFFARAVMEALPRLDFQPEVLHCNDWHTAMLPMLVKTQYAGAPQGQLRTLLTIHNIAYQGKFGFDWIRDMFGIEDRYFTSEFMELDGCANFLKAGCVFADRINTVSPTYAEEIKTPYFSERLDGILSARSHELSGILNGIDATVFDPEHDPGIAANYSAADKSGKAACKRALMEELGLHIGEGTPIVAMVTRMTAQKGFDLVECVLDELMDQDMAFVLLGTGDAEYENFMRGAEWRHKGRVCAYIGYDEALSHRVYAGADMLLMPSGFEPCGLSQMIAMRYGTLPIVRETGGLKDSVQPYNMFTGEGTGFSFANFNAHEMAGVIRNAVALYHNNRAAFDGLVHNAMTADFSFALSAEAYASLYITLLPFEFAAAHDAADEAFRKPLGALEGGSEVTLSIEDPARFVSSAVLELAGEIGAEEHTMRKTETGFTVTLTLPETPCALNYLFRLTYADGGVQWLCPAKDERHSMLSGERRPGFRLTVYRRGFETPRWFREGVMYQIFPDRFSRDASDTAKDGLARHEKQGQTVHAHADWDEPVEWRANMPDGSYAPIDFYGGTLKGITERLPELKELGVTVLYLNPIFEAASNHRYDTGSYEHIDPILGSDKDFAQLCETAKRSGIRIVLDGVFAHTGADSKYFNRFGHYPGAGAFRSKHSPYFKWYSFSDYPEEYRCWWDFQDLPSVTTSEPSWQKYIISGDKSIVKTWLARGASGWRLDVADELPDEILQQIRAAVKETDPDAVVLGEVWEDAVTKVSYDRLRTYALGDALDSVMNYPLRLGMMPFFRGQTRSCELRDLLLSQRLNYPKPLYYALMNLTASHDIDRTRTALSVDFEARDTSRDFQAAFEVTPEMAARGAKLQKLAAALQFALPGIPSIYYGDEVGMEGFCDPFCRAPYQVRDPEMRVWYRKLAALRTTHPALRGGAVAVFAPAEDVVCVLRAITDGKDVFGKTAKDEALLTVVNRAARTVRCKLDLSAPGSGFTETERLAFLRAGYTSLYPAEGGEGQPLTDGCAELVLPACSAAVYKLL